MPSELGVRVFDVMHDILTGHAAPAEKLTLAPANAPALADSE